MSRAKARRAIAQGKTHVPKPRRTFLERDELAALLAVAAEQDQSLANVKLGTLGPTAQLVAHLLAPRQAAQADRAGALRQQVDRELAPEPDGRERRPRLRRPA